mmetsp:Transcript_2643/g.3603  ORF Transcript_2643/g.3603 Transcript_2643/m.3603 type:complete len:93 (+) Transcript_2643:209-487(+)
MGGKQKRFIPKWLRRSNKQSSKWTNRSDMITVHEGDSDSCSQLTSNPSVETDSTKSFKKMTRFFLSSSARTALYDGNMTDESALFANPVIEG